MLTGGRAGDGIKQAGNSIARLFNRLGYWIFVYEDYPSLIRGGQNFAIVRAASDRILTHRDTVDVMIALNQETYDRHKWRLKKDSIVIYDRPKVKAEGLGLPLSEIAKSKGLPDIVRNTASLGALARVIGVDSSVVDDVIRSSISRNVEENLAVAREGYAGATDYAGAMEVEQINNEPKPLLNGNEILGLGAVKAGLKLCVTYPMTPTSGILHYLSENAERLGITVVQPENEIGGIGMVEGGAYAGVRTMIATSGGGFDLVVEHLSLAGQAEIPLVVVLGQRPGPSTGVPTHTAQADLLYAIFSGHGEFPKIVMAPGDSEEAYRLSGEALNLAWKFQIPVILMSDKHLSESTFSFDVDEDSVKEEPVVRWDGGGDYRRYAFTESGVSPLAFPGTGGAVVKCTSYEHDEFGITTEEPELIEKGHDKRLRKEKSIEDELRSRQTVRTYGPSDAEHIIVTWGSNKGACVEVANGRGMGVVQPLYLHPLPTWEFSGKLASADKVICVEANSKGQLATWLRYHGIRVDNTVLKYDGRPFTVEELDRRVSEVLQ